MQEGELSADLYTFHEAVSHLQEMEEDVLDTHKLVLDQIPKWHQACATLLAMTNEVDYDVDGNIENFLCIRDQLFIDCPLQPTFSKWKIY